MEIKYVVLKSSNTGRAFLCVRDIDASYRKVAEFWSAEDAFDLINTIEDAKGNHY